MKAKVTFSAEIEGEELERFKKFCQPPEQTFIQEGDALSVQQAMMLVYIVLLMTKPIGYHIEMEVPKAEINFKIESQG